MSVLSQIPILIIEDDEKIFARMERCLSRHATYRDYNIVVHHAVTFVGAKQKFNAYRPLVVSVDMRFPMNTGRPEPGMGVKFLQWANSKTKITAIVYSGDDEADIRKTILARGIYKSKATLPPVLKKSFNVSDDIWAQKLLDLVLQR